MNIETQCLKNLAVHYTGNKNNGEPIYLSDKLIDANDETLLLLQQGLLQKFISVHERYSFYHIQSLQYNEVYSYCKELFAKATDLLPLSVVIARHLYESSVHPKIKGGEVYVCLFENLPVEGRMYRAIGIFKTEHKAAYIDLEKKGRGFNLSIKDGVEMSKIDKGCLVIDKNEMAGYDVMIFDNQNRGDEALYWKELFLGLQQQQNEFHNTNHLLTLTKQFITTSTEAGMPISKKEQVEMLNKSITYFKSNEAFDINEFSQSVFADEDVIDSFRRFGSGYVAKNNFEIAAGFPISAEAVKKQARIFKSVLKLDKNFHIYIHGRTDLIEKGVDENGRKFYKIFYQSEE